MFPFGDGESRECEAIFDCWGDGGDGNFEGSIRVCFERVLDAGVCYLLREAGLCF